MNSYPVQGATLLALLASNAELLTLTLPRPVGDLSGSAPDLSPDAAPDLLPEVLGSASQSGLPEPDPSQIRDSIATAALGLEAEQIEWDAEWEADTAWEMALPAALKLPTVGLTVGLAAQASPEVTSLGQPTLHPVTDQIAELLGSYTTCRIWLDCASQRLFALRLEADYYSFSRRLPTRAAALKLANRLRQTGHRVLITTAEPGHWIAEPTQEATAVWIWQPEAKLAD